MDEFFYICNPDYNNIVEEDCATSVNDAVGDYLESRNPGELIPKTVTVTTYKLHRAAGLYSPVEKYEVNLRNWCAEFWCDDDWSSKYPYEK
jgi:hypothetical protein